MLIGPQCVCATLLLNCVLSPFLQEWCYGKHAVWLNSVMLWPILPASVGENDDNSVWSSGVTVIWKEKLQVL